MPTEDKHRRSATATTPGETVLRVKVLEDISAVEAGDQRPRPMRR
jgi:hypothetical protein